MVKKYPSQIKYENENPAITFRVPKEIKEKIECLVELTEGYLPACSGNIVLCGKGI